MFIQRKIIQYIWAKIVECQQNTILYKTYEMVKNDADRGCTGNDNWVYHIKLTCTQIVQGFS